MSRRRNVSLMSVLAGILLVLLLAACGGQSDTLPPAFNITSGNTTTTDSYTVKGTVTDAVGVQSVTYSLNGSTAQPVTITPGPSVTLNFTVSGLVQGNNSISLSAKDKAGNEGTKELHIGRLDSNNPVVNISSSTTSAAASYKLEGYAFDDQGVTDLSYTLNGGAAQNLTPDQSGHFSANLTLNAGGNAITVTAKDAQDNTGTASATVTYNAPPGTLTVTPQAAKRGDTIIITGSHFGASQGTGTVTVGGQTATITSWADGKVVAVVADSTPSGPQEVKLIGAYGSQTFENFFVGAVYTGDAAGLQAFLDGLPKGTAVQLGAQEYDLTDDLALDNHGLWGQGTDNTTLNSGTHAIGLFTDFGQDSTIADMTIQTDDFEIITGTLSTMSTLSTQGTSPTIKFGTRTLTLPAPSKLTQQFGSHWSKVMSPTTVTLPTVNIEGVPPVQPQGIALPQVHLSNLEVSEIAGGGTFGYAFTSGTTTPIPEADISIDHITYNGPTSAFLPVSSGAVSISDSTITGGNIAVFSVSSTTTVTDSDLEAKVPDLGGIGASLGLVAANGLSVDGSTVRTANGNAMIVGSIGALGGGSPLPMGGPITISNSTVEALDGDLTDGNAYGTLQIVTQFAPITLTDNASIRSDRGMTIGTQDSSFGNASVTLSDNQSIKVGVFKADDPANPQPATLTITTQNTSASTPGDTLTLTGNTISSTQAIQVTAGVSGPGNLVANDNTITAGDGNDDGMIQVGAASGGITFDGNTLSADASVGVIGLNLSGPPATFTLTNNTLNAIGDNTPGVTVAFLSPSSSSGLDSSCEITGNTFNAQDPGADNPAGVALLCLGSASTAALTATGNTFSVAGDGTSSVQWSFGSGILDLSNNQVSSEAGLTLSTAAGLSGAHATTGAVSNNTLNLGTDGISLSGDTNTDLTLDGNTVTLENSQTHGLDLSGAGQVTVTNNTFTDTGTPAATSTALKVATNPGDPVTVSATGNTFTNFTNALAFTDQATALGITATVNNNTFDFTIDAAPKVAELNNVTDAIDATQNYWNGITNTSTLESYVTLNSSTGSIDVSSPLASPPSP